MINVLRVLLISLLVISANNSAFSSSTSPANIKFEVSALESKMDIPPKIAYNRINLGADFEEVFIVISNLSKSGDQVSVRAEDPERKKVVIVWNWNFSHPASSEQSGELAIMKVFTNQNKVWAVSLEHIILNGENIERRIFERKSLDFIAEHEKK